eukprot:CAMPEP_0117419644 /NCGR_PEP_ID=MMETSP0758-20121206/1160_1 /TAXON_ID=63605 /ORGANISM="Percolomonas cosmopolitus, Strain AE-1 (ATCC 50343)" /LENGTH=120 /DNA_ID=CAMNT_0005200823 /DNA_START=649 /DNA_END=1007 /DNA_ORIENTATION=-
MIHDGNSGKTELTLLDFTRMCVKYDMIRRLEEEKVSYYELFDMLDSNHDGRLTDNEFQSRVHEITGQYYTIGQIKQMLSEVDEDADGQLDQYEFHDLMIALDDVVTHYYGKKREKANKQA